MGQVTYTRKAREDLLSVWTYIAADNPTAADRVLDAIDRRCARLSENPKLGRARSDMRPSYAISPWVGYLIFYREVPYGVEIVRVLHGARNLRAVFDADE